MKNFVVRSSAVLLPIVSSIGMFAEPAASESVVDPALAHPTCKSAQTAVAANPKLENDKIVGRVYNITGDYLWLELDDGSSRMVRVTRPERGYLGQIMGRKVVITNFFCERIRLAPPPAPIVEPVKPIKFEFTRPEPPVVPPPPPQPVPEPKPIIPQTW